MTIFFQFAIYFSKGRESMLKLLHDKQQCISLLQNVKYLPKSHFCSVWGGTLIQLLRGKAMCVCSCLGGILAVRKARCIYIWVFVIISRASQLQETAVLTHHGNHNNIHYFLVFISRDNHFNTKPIITIIKLGFVLRGSTASTLPIVGAPAHRQSDQRSRGLHLTI